MSAAGPRAAESAAPGPAEPPQPPGPAAPQRSGRSRCRSRPAPLPAFKRPPRSHRLRRPGRARPPPPRPWRGGSPAASEPRGRPSPRRARQSPRGRDWPLRRRRSAATQGSGCCGRVGAGGGGAGSPPAAGWAVPAVGHVGGCAGGEARGGRAARPLSGRARGQRGLSRAPCPGGGTRPRRARRRGRETALLSNLSLRSPSSFFLSPSSPVPAPSLPSSSSSSPPRPGMFIRAAA